MDNRARFKNQIKSFFSFLKKRSLSSLSGINSATVVCSPLFWVAGLYTVIYLPLCFIILEDLNLIAAYETDPGSIIAAINSLFDGPLYYNMHNGYHSQYYGWTYFSINFFMLLPIKAAFALFDVQNQELIHFIIRFTLFLIGIAGIAAFYKLIEKITRHRYLALFSSAFLVISPLASKGYYFIHPESTGILFSLLGCYALVSFVQNKNHRPQWYVFGLSALVLSALSKQIFLIISFPILGLFLYFWAQSHGQSLLSFLKTKRFKKNFLFTCVWSLVLLFVVHPYAIIQPDQFFKSQLNTILYHTGMENAVSTWDSLKIWWKTIFTRMPLYSFTVLTAPICLYISFTSNKLSKAAKILYNTNLISIITLLFIISYLERVFPGSPFYLYPLLPYMLLNIVGISYYLIKHLKGGLRIASLCMLIYSTFILFSFSTIITHKYVQNRMDYKTSISYIVFNYIAQELPKGARIAHGHRVAVPNNYSSCHYWHFCTSQDAIEKFDPDYIVFNKSFFINDKLHDKTEILKNYVEKNGFKLKTILTVPDLKRGKTKNLSISVYEKVKN